MISKRATAWTIFIIVEIFFISITLYSFFDARRFCGNFPSGDLRPLFNPFICGIPTLFLLFAVSIFIITTLVGLNFIINKLDEKNEYQNYPPDNPDRS